MKKQQQIGNFEALINIEEKIKDYNIPMLLIMKMKKQKLGISKDPTLQEDICRVEEEITEMLEEYRIILKAFRETSDNLQTKLEEKTDQAVQTGSLYKLNDRKENIFVENMFIREKVESLLDKLYDKPFKKYSPIKDIEKAISTSNEIQ